MVKPTLPIVLGLGRGKLGVRHRQLGATVDALQDELQARRRSAAGPLGGLPGSDNEMILLQRLIAAADVPR